MTENKQNHNHSWHDRLSHVGVLRVLKRNIMLQAALAIITIVLTIVLIFSLTVAWYTNVVQTGGLVLEAETWNFSGKIELLMSESIAATPGDEGVVSLRVANDSDHIVAASATVNKQAMDEEMRKRLYFYVDTTMERNGETVDRVYIAEKSSYTYTVFPNSELILSETVQNGPLIKWMWVYDVLGYYVLGQKTADKTTVKPEDYIRPIEYKYDPATTTFDANGYPASVNGTSVASFITELTKADGYAGAVDMNESVGGYYPVSVDVNGYGVWLYLCTKTEIEKNTAYDTEIGTNTTPTNTTATVTITGSNSREDGMPVTSVEELQTALSDPTVGIIRLADNITLTQTLNLTSGSATIDLNGKTLSVGNSVEKIIELSPGASLSLQNGTLKGAGTTDNHAAVTMSGAHLTMNGVDFTNVGTGIRVDDSSEASDTGSTVYINGCNLVTEQQALWIYGNENDSETRTKVVVKSSTLNGEGYAGILCNGSYGGTDILVSNSEVKGLYTAIYHPQRNSTLTIEKDSKLYGGTGLVVKGGTVTVQNSFVQGSLQSETPSYDNSGWSDTGDGIYLEANYASEEWPVSVTVTDCVVVSYYAYAVRKYESNEVSASLVVQSGTYSSFAFDGATVPADFNAVTYMESYKAEGSVATMDSDATKNNKCTVKAGTTTG